jgi:hypothetical protein
MNRITVDKDFKYKDYVELHNTVYDYQDKIPGAADKLIERFNEYIWRYVNLLSGGRASIENVCIRKFLSLYINNKDVKDNIWKSYRSFYKKEQLYEAANMLQKAFENVDIHEIRNDLVICLFEMALKYKDTRPSFHTYVDRCFHFRVFNCIAKRLKDPLQNNFIIEYNDEMSIDKSIEFDFIEAETEVEYFYRIINSDSNIPAIEIEESVYDNESLNWNWYNGLYCDDIFKTLSTFERKLILEYYVNKKSLIEISETYGYSRTHLNNLKNYAIYKMYIENKEIIDEHFPKFKPSKNAIKEFERKKQRGII